MIKHRAQITAEWIDTATGEIAPDHLLDLRARVGLGHTLVDQRGEWQQRIHALLYHHGCRRRRGLLLTADGRAWLSGPLGRDGTRSARSPGALAGQAVVLSDVVGPVVA